MIWSSVITCRCTTMTSLSVQIGIITDKIITDYLTNAAVWFEFFFRFEADAGLSGGCNMLDLAA